MKSRFIWVLLPFVIFGGVWAGALLLPAWEMASEPPIRFEEGTFFGTEKSPLAKQGSLVYGQLGCAECHTQHIALMWNKPNRQRDGARIILPDDYRGDYTAHFGRAEAAPDFSSPRETIRERLSIPGTKGEEVSFGTEKEWLLLHFYNPRDPVFKNPRSSCPALPFLFQETIDDGLRNTRFTLPVKMPEGKKLVPLPKAEQLADYLLSLNHHTPLPPELTERRKAFLPPGRTTFEFPLSAEKKKLSEQEQFLKTGAKVFSTQCSVCHGHDGTGDGFNYPPLAGSEWLALPTDTLCEIVLCGLRGPLQVKGKQWDNYMTPMAPRLTDREIAAVLTHVLATFAPERKETISPEKITELRQRFKDLPPLPSSELSGRLSPKPEKPLK